MRHPPSRLYAFFAHLGRLKWSLALKAVIAGAAGGLLAVCYRLATERGVEAAAAAYAYLRVHPAWLAVWVPAALGVGLLIAWLVRLEPMAAGGGVPQVEGVVRYGLRMRWYTVIAVRYAAGILGALFGLSFGPEGPSVQLGAAASQGLSRRFGRTKIEEDYMVTAGAAAGLSAAFGAPLTGTLFALEEIHRSFSPLVLLSATAASLTADFISKYFFGLQPMVYFGDLPYLPLGLYGWLLPLALAAGLAGIATNRGMLLAQSLFGRLPARFRPFAALLVALPCGLFLPQVLGGGRGFLSTTGAHETLAMLALLFAVKLVFSCTSVGSGTPGGIFMPIIAISALSGSLFGTAAGYLGLPARLVPLMVVCAMAGGLSACVKAPVTSIVLVLEVTGSLSHILPVAVCTFAALFLSDALRTPPVYEAFLGRYLHKNGYAAASAEQRGEAAEFAVEYGSQAAGRLIREVDWPQGALVVGLRRGDEEIIPGGGTRILTGDYLLVMMPRGRGNPLKRRLRRLCHSRG